MSWNSTSLNASIESMTWKPRPEAMSFNSSIHRVIVTANEKIVFSPNQLNAAVGDTILFTPVNFGDSIVQTSPDQPCQAVGSLSPLNFSRLIYPYLVTTEAPAWFNSQATQQDCAHHGKRSDIFILNPSNRPTVNVSTATSVAQSHFTSGPQASSLLRTANGPATSVLTALPSMGVWPINNCTAANSTIWATGAPNPWLQPSGTSFLGQAATKEISRTMVSLLITYYYFIGIRYFR